MEYQEWVNDNEQYIIDSYKDEKSIKKKIHLRDVPESFVKEMYSEFRVAKDWHSL